MMGEGPRLQVVRVTARTLCLYNVSMRLSIAIIVLLLSCVAFGCANPQIEQIDGEIQARIKQFQDDALGMYATNDPSRIPVSPHDSGVTDNAYRTDDLPTVNPGQNDLPAVLDDDPRSFDPQAADDAAPGEADPSGQPAIELDLEAALLYAIRDAREYRSQKEDLYLAALDLLAEKHLWGPRFFNTFSARVSGTPEAGDHDQVVSLVNDFSVTQRLPNGGEVAVSAVINFVEQLRADPPLTGASGTQDGSITVSAAIPLLRGAGPVAREPLIQAYRDLTYAARDFERFRRQFLVEISTDYYSLLQQQARIKNVETQLNSFIWLSARTKALADAGRVPIFEVQRAQQSELFARNDLINEREDYRNALDLFKLRLGIPLTRDITIKPTELEVPPPALVANKAVQTAWRHRLDVQTSSDRVDDSRRGVVNARNLLLPGLDLDASVAVGTDPDKDRAGLDLDAGAGSYTAGITFDAPLDRKVERLAYRRSLITLERSIRSHGMLRDQVALAVRSAIRSIRRAGFTLTLQNRNVETARTRLQGVELQLANLGPRDFVEAQDDLLEALNRRDSALRDLRVAVLNYLLESGQMRVSTRGQWLPPAKLVVPQPAPELDANAPWDRVPKARKSGRTASALESPASPESTVTP